MVTSVTNLGRNGLFDWIIQRLSALVIAAYVIFLLVYMLITPGLDYPQWQALFSALWMRIFSLLTLIALMAHGWIGMWTISTDYIKPLGLRFLFQMICAGLVFVYVVWGIEILWGA